MIFEQILKSAFDSGTEILIYMNGFNAPLKGRIQHFEDEQFTFLQNSRSGLVLWAFRLVDVLSCGLLVQLPEWDAGEDAQSQRSLRFSTVDSLIDPT